MTNKQVFTCKLSPFAGREQNSTKIKKQEIEYPSPNALFVTIEAAWSVTLHLYSGLNQVSFESRVNGSAATRVGEIQPQSSLATIITSLERDRVSDEHEYHYNTGVINNENDGQCQFVEALRPGKDVALHVVCSGLHVLARHGFMALDELRNLGETFSHALASFAHNPNQTIRHIGISGNDIAQIVSWNSGVLRRNECLIHDEFCRVSHLYPHKPAIESWDGHRSYQELDMTSNSLDGKLTKRGFNVGPGSWVPFCFDKSRWAIISMLAIIKARAACVPLDPRHPPGRVQQIVGTTGAKLILVGEAETKNRLFSDFPSLQFINVTKMDLDQNEEHPIASDKTSPTFESPAIGLFTSGSTGTPKGITAAHVTICTGASSYACHIGADDNTRVLQFASYTFDVCMVDIFTAILHGGTLCIPSEEERMDGLEEYIARTRPNWAALTPMVTRILDPATSSSFLQKLLFVGEMVRESDIEEWVNSGVAVYNVYGPAENNLITTAAQVIKGRAFNVGHGVNTRTWIADFGRERLLPIGAVGELIYEGLQLTPGYLNDPERTRSSFFDDLEWIPRPSIGGNHEQLLSRRFYRSGDLVRYCADGSLQCVGRLDSQVKLGGQRVELSDIESHIHSHNAAVLVPRAGPLQDKLIAVLEGVPSSSQPHPTRSSTPFTRCDLVTVKTVIKTLRAKVPSYMCPSVWISIGNLPASASGKLDRKALMIKLERLSQEESDNSLGRNVWWDFKYATISSIKPRRPPAIGD
ncbi:Apicidin F synthase [Fusarium equiseti]|uniref:Apicidin F synthase n=1 Tax=Fusarium equiseti TaxID=61235 RepID=A0ABQ8QVV0_FUSEQ|nr:Apicidin F synthase [Fusarium equiseti]